MYDNITIPYVTQLCLPGPKILRAGRLAHLSSLLWLCLTTELYGSCSFFPTNTHCGVFVSTRSLRLRPLAAVALLIVESAAGTWQVLRLSKAEPKAKTVRKDEAERRIPAMSKKKELQVVEELIEAPVAARRGREQGEEVACFRRGEGEAPILYFCKFRVLFDLRVPSGRLLHGRCR